MVKEAIRKAEGNMKAVLDFMKKELAGLHVGRASASLLDGIFVNAYGSRLPVNQVATITTPQPNLLLLQPWDKALAGELNKAIMAANLGINPVVDAGGVRLPIPPLSEERRKEVAQIAHKIAEQGRVEIREVRRKIKDALKEDEKNKRISEDDFHQTVNELQKLTDREIQEIDNLLAAKEKEIME